jgi:16S rRNA (guanine527-N7)-methyltransferase
VVDAVAESLDLTNVKTSHKRAEDVDDTFDFIVSRAVTAMPTFVGWVKRKVYKKSKHSLKNGILYLKGGDLTDELRDFPKATLYNLSDYFEESFFDTKKVVHLPLKYKG